MKFLRRRRQSDQPVDLNVIPLIDVVFFLVIAFMMISHLTTARPFAVALPESVQQQGTDGEFTLFLSAAGQAGFISQNAVLTGETALLALSQALADHGAGLDCAEEPPALQIAADAATPAPVLAALLPRLAAMGFASVQLVTTGG